MEEGRWKVREISEVERGTREEVKSEGKMIPAITGAFATAIPYS